MSRAGRVARNTGFNVLTGVVTSVALFATGVLVARALGPDDTGVYNLLTFSVVVVLTLASSGLGIAASKYVGQFDAAEGEAQVAAVIRFAIRACAVATIALAGLLALAAPGLASLFGQPGEGALFALAALAAVPLALRRAVEGSLQGLQRQAVLLPLALAQGLGLLGGSAAVLAAGGGLAALMLVQFGVGLAVVGLFTVALRQATRRSPAAPLPRPLRSRMMSYAGSVTALSALDIVVWQRSEIVLLGIFAASEEVAYYSIAFAVADAVQQAVPQAIQTALFPTQSRAVETGDRVYLQQAYETSVRLLVLVTVPVAVAGSVLAAPLIVTVYGEAYAEAVLPLQVLLFSAGAGRVGYAFSSVLYAADRERLMLKLTGVWAVLNLGLGIVLVPALGLVGAVIANASVQVLAVVVAPFVVRRKMGLRFPFADVLRVLAAGVPLALVLAAVVAVVDGDLLALGVGGLLALPAYVAGLALTRAVPPAERAVLREQVQRLTGRPSG